jgi:hypothetical protein
MVQFTGEAYTAGVKEVERYGVKRWVYSFANKTMADCSSTATRLAWTWRWRP